jgi:hypothetical protein
MAKTKLENMTLADLWKRFKEATGHENKSPNKKFLIKAIKDAEAEQRKTARAARREQIAATASAQQPADEEPAGEAEHENADHVVDDDPAHEAAERSEAIASSDDNNEAGDSGDGPTSHAGDHTASPLHASHDEADLEVAMEAEMNLAYLAADASPGSGSREEGAEELPALGTTSQPPPVGTTGQALPVATTGQLPAVATTDAPRQRGPKGRFSAMTVAELRALYVEKVGRETGSDDKAYLIWKIREAEKGKITVGAIQRSGNSGDGGAASKRFADIPLEDLRRRYGEVAGRTPESDDRGVLVRGIVAAEKAAARATKRFADVTTGDLQKLYEDKRGEATESEDRAFLIRAITATVTSERGVDLSRYGSDRDKPVLPLRLAKDAVTKMDQTWAEKGYRTRIAFIREALKEKLLRLGADEAASLFA